MEENNRKVKQSARLIHQLATKAKKYGLCHKMFLLRLE
jgi:hypothetical protein